MTTNHTPQTKRSLGNHPPRAFRARAKNTQPATVNARKKDALSTRHDAIDQWHAAHSRANRHGCLGRWVALAIDASGTLGPDHAICRSRKSSCKDDEPQRTDRTQQTKRPFHQVTSMSKASKTLVTKRIGRRGIHVAPTTPPIQSPEQDSNLRFLDYSRCSSAITFRAKRTGQGVPAFRRTKGARLT